MNPVNTFKCYANPQMQTFIRFWSENEVQSHYEF